MTAASTGGQAGKMSAQPTTRSPSSATNCTASRAKGITRVELETRVDNARAIGLYEKLGFVHEARKKNAMRFEGVYHDALQMCLLLS